MRKFNVALNSFVAALLLGVVILAFVPNAKLTLVTGFMWARTGHTLDWECGKIKIPRNLIVNFKSESFVGVGTFDSWYTGNYITVSMADYGSNFFSKIEAHPLNKLLPVSGGTQVYLRRSEEKYYVWLKEFSVYADSSAPFENRPELIEALKDTFANCEKNGRLAAMISS